ncbi:MAG TPA: peptidyl-prolyl cis-trans isomerase [Anaeromyxobacter sp.]
MRSAFAALPLVLSAACATGAGHLARVNDELVTGNDLRHEFTRHHVAMDKFLAEDAEVRKYLDQLVNRRVLVQEGYRLGLHESSDVRESVGKFRTQRTTALFLREQVEARINPTDAEVKATWDALPDQLEAREVVVRTREEAEAVRAAIIASGDMEEIARKRSRSESATRGGMVIVGWGGEEARERALLALQPPEVSAVYQTEDGWAVARVEKRKKLERPPFETAAPKIRQVLKRRRRALREAELYPALWAKYGARAVECLPTVDDLKRGAERKDPTPCATWNGGAVTAEALARRVKLGELGARPETWPELRKALVEDLVNREIVKLEAEALGYGRRPEVVDAVRVQQDDLVEAKLLKEHVERGVEVTDDDARGYYEAHQERYVEDARFELAQILADTADEAAEIAAKLRTGQPFRELAETRSSDRKSAAEGGRVGVIAKKELTGEFAPVAALAEGEVSAPIRTKIGFHLVKVLSIVPERPHAFDEVKERARSAALEEKQRGAYQHWVGALRASARVELSDRGIRAYEKEQVEALRRDQAEKAAELARKKAADEAARAAAVAAQPSARGGLAQPAEAPPATAPAPVAAPAAASAAPGTESAPRPAAAPAR